jgi:hypothetical protein
MCLYWLPFDCTNNYSKPHFWINASKQEKNKYEKRKDMKEITTKLTYKNTTNMLRKASQNTACVWKKIWKTKYGKWMFMLGESYRGQRDLLSPWPIILLLQAIEVLYFLLIRYFHGPISCGNSVYRYYQKFCCINSKYTI